MNIFCTNIDPIIAAQDLCDQHVRSKMQIEGAIMLAHAFPQSVLDHESCPRTAAGKPRRRGKGYFNHQCSIWARETTDNFMWLVEHTLHMFNERKFRWPGSKDHFTYTFIKWCSENLHNTIIDKSGLTEFAVAIKDSCNCRLQNKNFDSLPVIDKYREYIRKDKSFATWTGRNRPSWY